MGSIELSGQKFACLVVGDVLLSEESRGGGGEGGRGGTGKVPLQDFTVIAKQIDFLVFHCRY